MDSFFWWVGVTLSVIVTLGISVTVFLFLGALWVELWQRRLYRSRNLGLFLWWIWSRKGVHKKAPVADVLPRWAAAEALMAGDTKKDFIRKCFCAWKEAPRFLEMQGAMPRRRDK